MKERKLYRGTDWEEQRKKALDRDNHRCRKCKKFTNKVHHIRKWHQIHDNSLSNLISLCDRHHKIMDNDFTRIGMTNYVKRMILENARMEVDMLKKNSTLI